MKYVGIEGCEGKVGVVRDCSYDAVYMIDFYLEGDKKRTLLLSEHDLTLLPVETKVTADLFVADGASILNRPLPGPLTPDMFNNGEGV
jgi:hypothetical protein